MEKSKIIQIMVVDDHRMILDGIQSLIDSQVDMELKYIAKDGNEAIRTLKIDSTIDLIITDINMPNITGVDLCKYVNTHYAEINLLVLSMDDDIQTIKELLKAGALGYILKNTGKDELFEAIRTVYQNESYFSGSVQKNILDSMTKAKKVPKNGARLSKREIEIIKLISNELTTNEIAEKLFISLHTVESHRKNILRKTNSRNIAGLMKYALKEGLIE